MSRELGAPKPPEYNANDDLANIEALKQEMFRRAFKGDERHSTTSTSGYGFEIGSHAANAYANLVLAQVALKGIPPKAQAE